MKPPKPTAQDVILSLVSSAMRLGALALIWVPVILLFDSALRGPIQPTVLMLTLIPLAFYISHRIFRLPLFDMQRQSSGRTPVREMAATSTRDLLALLDEDDLDDLRDEVRETLRERIHRLSDDDEPASFEVLLSEGITKRKRRT